MKNTFLILSLLLAISNLSAQTSTRAAKCIMQKIKAKDSLVISGVTKVSSFVRKGKNLYYFENKSATIVSKKPTAYQMIYYNDDCSIAATLTKTAEGKIIVSKGFYPSDFVKRPNEKILWSAPVRMD